MFVFFPFILDINGRTSRVFAGGGMGTKSSQIRSEKIMAASSVGCVLNMLRLFFFFFKEYCRDSTGFR